MQCATESFVKLRYNTLLHCSCKVLCMKYQTCCTVSNRNLFLPYTINEWKKLDPEIRRIFSYVRFRNKLISFIKPTESLSGPLEIKFGNRLRVDFSHLNEHKFRHNFGDTLNPLLQCFLEIESIALFFLHGRNYTDIRINLMNKLKDIHKLITSRKPNELLGIVFYTDGKFTKFTLMSTNEF